jgi:DNA-binding response OmpR family regulator
MKTKPKYSLLYVEDEALIRKMAVSFLEDMFYEIYEAEDGEEAFALYQTKKPDIIITDIQMPRMDGLTFCKKVREKDNTTPVIIMTAYSHTEYLLQATELNLVKYLIKPVDEESLTDAISICFQRIEERSPSVVYLGEGYFFDGFNHTLTKAHEVIRLTPSQTALLEILVRNRGSVVSYQQLENSIWYDSAMSKDALRCLVRDIRKLTYKGIIENISRVGYRVNFDG